MKIGYARVSTIEQRLEAQIDQLQAHGCEKIYQERNSGGDRERPTLNEIFGYLRAGDTLLVVKLDRLSRSLKDLLELATKVDALGAQLQSLEESIDTSSRAIGGRPFALNKDQRNEVVRMRNEGRSLSELSRLFDVSRSTIARRCEGRNVARAVH